MLVTLHTANRTAEDIRQPLDNPHLEADASKLSQEIEKFRTIAEDRIAREDAFQARKPRLYFKLRVFSGEVLEGSSSLIAKSYEELQRAFVEVFPWHIGELVCEYPDGSCIHPQTATFEPGDVVHFRELTPMSEDLVTHHLQGLSAGWTRQTYRPTMLALTTKLIGGEANMKQRRDS